MAWIVKKKSQKKITFKWDYLVAILIQGRKIGREGGKEKEQTEIKILVILHQEWELGKCFTFEKKFDSFVLLESQYKNMIYWDVIGYFHIVNALNLWYRTAGIL